MRLVVTRPQPQADEWATRLQALGIDAVALPLLGIDAPADAAAVHSAWQRLGMLALVMFVSPSAVERFFAARPPGMDWPDALTAGSTGPGTQAALLRAAVPADRIVTPPSEQGRFDSEALWQQLAGRSWFGREVLIVRGEGGRDWLADTLRQQGAQVHFVEAYRRTAPVLDDRGRAVLAAALADPAGHCWLFSSSEAVRQLPALAPGADWSSSRALATHERIAETARALGFAQVEPVDVTPEAVAARVGASGPSIQSARP